MSKFLFGLAVLTLGATQAAAQQDRFADPHPIDFSQPWNTDLNKRQVQGPPLAGSVKIVTREDVPMTAAASCPQTADNSTGKPAVRPTTGTGGEVQKPACDTQSPAQDKARP